MDPPAGVNHCYALLEYNAAARSLVTSLKLRNQRSALPWLGLALAQLVDAHLTGPVDTCTWAPTAVNRRRRRGFDHAQLLAKHVGRQLDVPVRSLLRRSDRTQQTGHGRADRLAGPQVSHTHPAPTTVLLVDDITTTGATLSAAAWALRQAGATHVLAACLAHRRWEP